MVFGVLLSKVNIRGIGFGSTGIVLVALIFGHYGLAVPPSIEKIGLILFIFAVGIQAGPGFFESFKTGEARQYLIPTFTILGLLFIIALSLAYILGLDYQLIAGLFAGLTTSTPTLAAIVENSGSNTPIITYTLAYPVALLTTIMMFKLLPKILNLNIDEEEKKYREETLQYHPKIRTAHFHIENKNIFDKPIADLNFHNMSNAIITRVLKQNAEEGVIPKSDTVLTQGDLVKVVGDEDAIKNSSFILGSESEQTIPLAPREQVTSILVTNRGVIGKSLLSLNLDGLWGAEITEIRRAGVNVIPTGTTRLRFGDKILVTVNSDTAPNLIRMLGGIESTTIDFLPISICIVLGIIIGQVSISLGDAQIGPGMSGGILLTTLILGRIGKTGPMLWNIAGRTNQFLRELGLMFFLCGVGSAAGQNFLASFSHQGVKTIAASVGITIASILITSLVVLKIQKMNKLRFIGALAGSLTCAAALPTPQEIKNSSVPLTAYSVTYPFALFLTILIGQLFLLFQS